MNDNLDAHTGERGSVLYHVGHYGFFSKMLLHRLVFHEYCDAIFILDIGPGKTRDFMSKWNDLNSELGSVYLYSDNSFRKKMTISEVEGRVELYFDTLFNKMNKSLDDFKTIYSGFDWWNAFGAYLHMKNKKYIIFDTGGSVLNNGRLYDVSRHKDSESAYWGLQAKYKTITTDSSNVHGVIWDSNEFKIPGKENININYVELRNRLAPAIKENLVRAFLNKHIEFKNSYTLIPLRSFSAVSRSEIKKFEYLLSNAQRLLVGYRVLIDYCCMESEKIILKIHPNSNLDSAVDETFFDVRTIPGYFPFEYLPLLDNFNISKIINVGSSSTKYIIKPEDSLDILNPTIFFNHFPEMFCLDLSIQIAKQIQSGSTPNIYCALENWSKELRPLLSYMAKGVNIIEYQDCSKDFHMKIVDESSISMTCDKVDKKTLCTFVLNPSIELVKSFCGNFTIMKVEKNDKTGNAINYLGDLDPEYVMIIPKSIDIGEIVKNYHGIRQLPRCELELVFNRINIDVFTNEKLILTGTIEYRAALKGNRFARNYIWTSLNDFYSFFEKKSSEIDGCVNRAFTSFYDSMSILAEMGDSDAMAYLGRMYRDGRGVDKDTDKALFWMRKSSNIIWWVGVELSEMLLRTDSNDNHREAFDICLKIGEEKSNPKAMGHLGRMYRDGKGVAKDVDESAKWFKSAADMNSEWVVEATDAMLRTNNQDNWNYAFKRCNEVADTQPRVYSRISLMYRDGKGVKKNLKKAEEFMLKAEECRADKGN